MPVRVCDLPHITGDRIQLQQVIMNLVRNTSDAMAGVGDRPRHLAVRTERDEGDRVRLTVQDLGVGLQPHVMDKLFQAFYTTKSTGMALAHRRGPVPCIPIPAKSSQEWSS